MNGFDEPVLQGMSETVPAETPHDPAVRENIRKLLSEQPYAVLCTQGGGQPYGSLVAFAAVQDLSALVFATPITTRKYRLLSECDRVALLVDDRSRFDADISRIQAVTATGRARILAKSSGAESWYRLLIDRHAYMRGFITAETTALVRVDIVRYLHVTRLQEVRQWIPRIPGQ